VARFTRDQKLAYLKFKVDTKEYDEIIKRINLSLLDNPKPSSTPNTSKLKYILKYFGVEL
jgi:hypothetical protein